MAVLSAVGSVILTILRGWKWGVGFLVGAAISVLSFRLIHSLAAGLEPSRKRGSATRFAVLAAMPSGPVKLSFFGASSLLLLILVVMVLLCAARNPAPGQP